VMLALLPGTLLAAWLFGIGVLVNVVLGVCTALIVEALALRLRGRSVQDTLSDGSAALAGWLLALCVTPTLPAWQLMLGVLIAILLAKHVFGGIGHNPFNPAMVGYAVLLISFPQTMNAWPAHAALPLNAAPPSPAVTLQADAPFDGEPAADWHALTGQTPLEAWRTARHQPRIDDAPLTVSDPGPLSNTPSNASHEATVRPPGERQALLALAWLIGGLWLLRRGVIAWHIPFAVLATLSACELVAQVLGAATIGPLGAPFSGAAMLGAFFIATDPVSAAATTRGRLVYGAGIGLITFAIRSAGGWPEGVAFGVLLMNGAVPMIDRLSGAPPRSADAAK